MRILVTGGTGFVGCHTVAALHRAGHELRLLIRAPERVAPALTPLGVDPAAVETVVGDVTDAGAVRRAVEGCEAVLHAAGVYSLDPARADEIARVNAPGTELVLRSAAEAGLDPIVHVSSYAALLPPRSARLLDGDSPVGTSIHPYTGSKAASEAAARALQAEGAPVRISYPGMVWGPDDPHLGESSRLALAVLAGRLPALPPGTVPVSDVRDVAAVHAALAAPGLLGQRLGRLGVDLLPSREATWAASQDGSADGSATARELGVSFRPAEESIRDTIRWLSAAGHLSPRRAGALAAAA